MFGVAGARQCVVTCCILTLAAAPAPGKDDEANGLAESDRRRVPTRSSSTDAVYSRVLAAASPLRTGWLLRPAGRYPSVRIRLATSLHRLRPHSLLLAPSSTIGVSDIFPARPTAERNPDAVVERRGQAAFLHR